MTLRNAPALRILDMIFIIISVDRYLRYISELQSLPTKIKANTKQNCFVNNSNTAMSNAPNELNTYFLISEIH